MRSLAEKSGGSGDIGTGAWAGRAGGEAGGCCCSVLIHSGTESGCTRLDADIFFCGLDVGGPSCRIHAGSDCSSINELAEILCLGLAPSSVLGTENEDERNVPSGDGVSFASPPTDRIQFGNVPSPALSVGSNPAEPLAEDLSLARNDSSHAGSSACSCVPLLGPNPCVLVPGSTAPHLWHVVTPAGDTFPQRLHVINYVPHFRQA
jgi:hypothetical protein